LRATVRRTDPARLRALYRNTLTPQALRVAAQFPGVRCTTLVCYGTDDPYFPPEFYTRSVACSGPGPRGWQFRGAGIIRT
jgi:pimeloyl-ACP methyl ester carboxylesterase